MSNDDLDTEFTSADYRDLAEHAALSEAFARDEINFEFDPSVEPVELPPAGDAEHLVVRSLRLPLSLELRVQQIAKARGVRPTALMRDMIARGTEEAEHVADPVAELRSAEAAVSRALWALESSRRAA